jgi:hypothetical protein
MKDTDKLNEVYERINELTNIVNDLLEDKEIATDLSKALETRDYIYTMMDNMFVDLDYWIENDVAELDAAEVKETLDRISAATVEYFSAKTAFWVKARRHNPTE